MSEVKTRPTFEPPTVLSSTAVIPPADQCVCVNDKRYRAPHILLEEKRDRQGNKCVYCHTAPVQCLAHLCNNKSCRNTKHLVGSCNSCNTKISNQARGRSANLCVSVPSPHEETDPIAINRDKEPQWANFCSLQLSYCAPIGPFHEYTDTNDGERVVSLRK